jgi:MFS family permease
VRRSAYRDLLAGGVCLAAGIGVLEEAWEYTIGSLTQVGPGFYPAILGALLVVVGILIAGAALTTAAPADEHDALNVDRSDVRGWFCIIAGVLLFMLFAWLTGLAAAIFVSVFVAALGDRTATFRSSLVLALVMSVAGSVIFGYLLHIAMPIWQWPWAP